MVRVCAWCHQWLGDTEPLEDPSVMYSVCGPCYDRVKNEMEAN